MRPDRVDRPTARMNGDRRELVIESMGAQGDGIAGGVFAALTLPGERVAARVAGERGDLVEVLGASPDRVAAPCPHFGECGGCALQHWARGPYLAWKADLIRQALVRVGLETEILPPFEAPPSSRRRLALHARRIDGRACIRLKARRAWRVGGVARRH